MKTYLGMNRFVLISMATSRGRGRMASSFAEDRLVEEP